MRRDSIRASHLLLPILLLLLASHGCATPAAPTIAVFTDSWDGIAERRWPGRDWNANRVQDWQVRDGRLECVVGRKGPPVRTVHLLTRRITEESDAPVLMRVWITPTEEDASWEGDGFAGFLIGTGAPDIDYRLTALIQHSPAQGGGILAGVDGTGRVYLLDFSSPAGKTGQWSIHGPLDISKLSPLAVGSEPVHAPARSIELQLRYGKGGQDGLELSAISGGQVVSSATLPTFERSRLAGGLGLFSHGGPRDGSHGHAFSNLILRGATAFPDRAFGPILGVQYTINGESDGRRTLRLTAQLPVLGPGDQTTGYLQIEQEKGHYHTIATSKMVPDSYTLPFQIDDWDASRSTPYRVVLEPPCPPYDGVVQAEPGDTVVMASLGGIKNFTGGLQWNHDGLWFPHADLVERVEAHRPDLLFFSGDQIYEGDISPPDWSSEENTLLDYHTRWRRFLWSFGELLRRIPSVAIPDDHDVYHGNVWGAGGIRAVARDGLTAQDAGGYRLPAWIVNAIHRTQTSHFPDPTITGAIGQGILPYTTRLLYGGLDCAIIADRMWKDSASVMVPEGRVRNGFFRDKEFDPRRSDVASAQLLGPEQEAFLDRWAEDRAEEHPFKVVLSQTPFSCLHTLPNAAESDSAIPRLTIPGPGEYPENDLPVADTDSNGWPQSARNRAVRALKKANALHLAGDQHLGTVVRYGIDQFGDGTIAFTAPATANTWPRRWMPAAPGANHQAGAPRYTGDYFDGFGNRITMLAATNPLVTGRQPAALFDRSPGYGIVRFDPRTQSSTLEAWPRWADPAQPGQMFEGWPLTFELE